MGIKTGHKLCYCSVCDKACHFTCSSASFFHLTEAATTFSKPVWHCNTCIKDHDGLVRYNPFADIFSNNQWKEEEPVNFGHGVHHMHDILQKCKNYTYISDYNTDWAKLDYHTNFNVFFNNIDGNQSNFDALSVELKKYKNQISVIALCETNISVDHKDLYPLEGYESHYQTKINGKSKGSGLGLYISKEFIFEELPSLCITTANIEALFVKITNTKEEITIGVVYRPPNGSLKQFLFEIEKILIKLPKDHVYLAGDFNINLHDIDENNYASKFDRTILEHGFAPSISLWTHCMPNQRETCIDNIFTNAFESISSSCTILEGVSHHLPLICSASSPEYEIGCTDPVNETPQPRYEFNQANCDNLRSSTSKLADEHLSAPIIETAKFNNLLHDFGSSIKETCQVEASSGSKRNQVFKPWITQGIIVASNKKHDFFLEWRDALKKKSKIKNTLNNPEFIRLDLLATNSKSQYNTYRKKLKYIIRHAKRLYNLKKFEEVKGDPKATWKLINNLRGKKKNSRTVPSFLIDGELVMNKRIIANAFNKYFVSIASKLNNNDEPTIEPLPDFRSFLTKHVSRSIVLEDTNSSEIEEIIQGFANGKASDLPVTAVKQCTSILSPVLTLYFNHFMREGIFPDILKIGRITPIYKNKGSKLNFNNWRPISILPIFGKIFEKIIYKRLYSFLTSQNLIYSKQFGFRKGHSTSHALNHSVNFLTEAVANKKHTIGIFIDLSKAFDTIDHNKLLTKLDIYGIRGTAGALIESYISTRKQYTTFDNEKSDHEVVVYGVPQGSVLGPLLFLLYINDIVNCSTDGEFVLYADDTNIFVVGPSKAEVFRKANAVIKRVQSYMLSNLLHINTTKCHYMYFKPNIHSRNICARSQPFDQDCKLYLNGSIIKQVSTVKFLGVTIDENLTWTPHLENLKKKLSCSQGVLYRIKDSIPKSLHKTLYHSLFESHLIYGISVWGAQSHTVLHDLFTLQKHCIRTLFGNHHAKQKIDTYCYCNYGESGTMLCCEKCNIWFHDECLGLTEGEVSNINIFYCSACENRYDVSTKYVVSPLPSSNGKYCYCREGESGLMIECGKCKEWFHNTCLDLSECTLNQTLLYFCKECISRDTRKSLKIISIDYTKEHTKPLFIKHEILSVFNLYPYHCLLELYKILKFRTPYCIFEQFQLLPSQTGRSLTLKLPIYTLRCQKQTFSHQTSIFWNRMHKKLLKPSVVNLHQSHTSKLNLLASEVILLDYSTKIAAFKSGLRKCLLSTQASGGRIDWSTNNYISNR